MITVIHCGDGVLNCAISNEQIIKTTFVLALCTLEVLKNKQIINGYFNSKTCYESFILQVYLRFRKSHTSHIIVD